MSEPARIFEGRFDARNISVPRPRDFATQRALNLIKSHPDYTFADIKKVVGEIYPRRFATGPVFDYIVEKIIGEYIQPNLTKVEARSFLEKKVGYARNELTLAGKDDLTGLPRRQLFREIVEAELKRSRPRRLILFDLDHFKKFNDVYGHPAGDLTLKAFSRMLASFFPSAARWGGEEFVVAEPLGENTDDLLSRLRETFKLFVDTEFPDHNKQIDENVGTFSTGETALSFISDFDEAMKQADGALYEAKRTGRNKNMRWSEVVSKR